MYEEYYEKPKNVINPAETNVRSSSFLSKVYGYMAIGILITALVAFGVGFGFQSWMTANPTAAAYETYLFILIGSIIGLLVVSIVISIISLRGKHSIIVPAIIYSVLMGVVFSEFVLFIPFYIIGMAFAITAMTFAIMYFLSKVIKKNLNWLGTLGFGLLMGAFLMSAFFFIFYLIAPNLFSWLYVIIDGVFFVAMLFITMFDVWRIQQIANKGSQSNNLALYCAFSLYVDFMYILMRLIIILARIFGTSRR
ncbi:MAG TPA: Bax inhibitor-1 family protein [Bacilli bacterium]|nr:Bax inhibitor-1 family protein [Bacilli bacterium]HPS18670.1 Bax inhibitor-1 family protein [Bacilli bacterium]